MNPPCPTCGASQAAQEEVEAKVARLPCYVVWQAAQDGVEVLDCENAHGLEPEDYCPRCSLSDEGRTPQDPAEIVESTQPKG
jgi:hypothetical protein